MLNTAEVRLSLETKPTSHTGHAVSKVDLPDACRPMPQRLSNIAEVPLVTRNVTKSKGSADERPRDENLVLFSQNRFVSGSEPEVAISAPPGSFARRPSKVSSIHSPRFETFSTTSARAWKGFVPNIHSFELFFKRCCHLCVQEHKAIPSLQGSRAFVDRKDQAGKTCQENSIADIIGMGST